MKIFERNVSRLQFGLFLFEFVLLLGILTFIHFLRFVYQEGWGAYWLFDGRHCLLRCLLFVVCCQACMYLNELYDYKVSRGRRELTIRLLQSLGIACILLGLLYTVFETLSIGQVAFLLALPAFILGVFLSRLFYGGLTRSTTLSERVAILGSSDVVHQVARKISEVKDIGYELAALFTEGRTPWTASEPEEEPRAVFPLEEFPERIETMDIDRIVIAIQDRRGTLPFETLVDCRFRGIQVEEMASFYESLYGKIFIEGLRPSWLIFSEGFRKSKFTLRIKRLSDILMAVLLLALASPLLLLTAVLIKLDSRGPVIYRQDRVGEGWKDYTLYKFRSMVENAEAAGVQWAAENDVRITRVGRFIRKYRIDEVPQLFNVIKGDMSFVGPRPERRHFVVRLAKEIPYYPQRLFVKPGVTGWAQVKYHYGASQDDTMEKLQYDLYYIKHMSFFFDLSIIFDTIRVVLTGAGAR